ncbi:MAG: cytochrome c oxidase subunit 3 [Edaphocola sp.]
MTQATTATTTGRWGGGTSPYNLGYGKIMMWFFLLSDAFTFGALLISLGAKRFFSNVWPDANHVFRSFPGAGHANLPLVFVSLMTFILILSSVTMVLAVHAGHCNNKKAVVTWLLLTIVGGIAFLSCQCWEWVHLHGEGAWWGSFIDASAVKKTDLEHFYKKSVYDSMNLADGIDATHSFFNFFFTITGFHGAHVLSGVVFNVMILINTVNGTYERRGHYEMVEKIGLYWHFVDLVWVFVFTCFYLL